MRRPRSLRQPRSERRAQVDAPSRNSSAVDAARVADQAQDGAPGRGLAGAAFADDAQPLAAQGEGDVAHGSDIAVAPG